MMRRVLVLLATFAATWLHAGDATVPGTLSAPNPTTCGIGIVWPFSGDADGDGRVTLRYRRVGDTAWATGLPLFRVPAGSTAGMSWADRHLGSLFDLQAATTYQIEVTLSDPDGGSIVQTITVTTRALPAPMAGAVPLAVTPATFAAALTALVPGTVLELGAGTYPGFTCPVSGSAAQPIVIRSGVGALIDGSIELVGRNHVQLHGLTVHGRIRLNTSVGIAVTGCAIVARADRGAGDGIVAYRRAENAYIADNTVIGTTIWGEAALGSRGANLGEGICLTGPGGVVRNNRVRGFRDGLSLMEESEADSQFSIDLVENDISECADDGIEADFAAGNVRVARNRVTNCFIAISSQPSLGGPTYFVRNAIYNAVHVAFKLYRTSHGDVLLHNTVVKNGSAFHAVPGVPIMRTHSRNNLFLGGPGGTYGGYSSGDGEVMHLRDLDRATANLDYDGFGTSTGAFAGNFGGTVFSSLAQLRAATSEVHAVSLGFSVFATAVAYPSAPMTVYAVPDLRLASGSAAVDVGIALPGISDGYAGAAPDLGAYEYGQPVPTYGPRVSGDATPPMISGIVATVSGTTVVIAWTTDEPADAQVDFGPTVAYDQTSAISALGSTSHSRTLTSLAAGIWHYRVRSRDAAGNLALGTDRTITVVGVTVPPPGGGTTPPAVTVAGSGGGGGGGCGLGGSLALLTVGLGLLVTSGRSRR